MGKKDADTQAGWQHYLFQYPLRIEWGKKPFCGDLGWLRYFVSVSTADRMGKKVGRPPINRLPRNMFQYPLRIEWGKKHFYHISHIAACEFQYPLRIEWGKKAGVNISPAAAGLFQYPLRIEWGKKCFAPPPPPRPQKFQYPLRIEWGKKISYRNSSSNQSTFQYPLRIEWGKKIVSPPVIISVAIKFQYPLRIEWGKKQVGLQGIGAGYLCFSIHCGSNGEKSRPRFCRFLS